MSSGNRRGTAWRSVTAVAVVAVLCAFGGLAVQPEAHAAAASAAATVTIDGKAYPNPLRADDGSAITTAAQWEGTRRAELLAAFRKDVYGHGLPAPTAQTFAVTTTSAPGGGTRKTITITVRGPDGTGSFDLQLVLPATPPQKPRGTFLLIDHRGSAGKDSDYTPISAITGAGYAFASFDANQVAPDNAGDYRSAVLDLFHPAGEALPDDAGRAISAWAWAASRAMDYLQTDPDLDPTKVAVVGHSRSGKAALWAGAQDTRFTAVVSNDSGAGGAALARYGSPGAESVAQLTGSFPHWFPPAYAAYGDRVDALPVDQHELLALVAPRRVVVGSATEDANADPEAEFRAYQAAAPVYALYGLGGTGLPSSSWPPAADTGFRGPAMSYHLRSGGHGLTAADWKIYLDGGLFGA